MLVFVDTDTDTCRLGIVVGTPAWLSRGCVLEFVEAYVCRLRAAAGYTLVELLDEHAA